MIPIEKIPIVLPKVPSCKREQGPVEMPLRMAFYLVHTGTRNGNLANLVMGDELIAMRLAECLKKISPQIEETWVLNASQEPPSEANAFFFLHHDIPVRNPRMTKDRPAWLWIQNAGFTPASLSFLKWKKEYYTNVFHAGKKIAQRMGYPILDFGIEDENIFKPTHERDTDGIVFVGNLIMHQNAVESFKLLSAYPEFQLYGKGWSELGIKNHGVIPQDEVPFVLAGAKVCLDTVSSSHLSEGMTSTRIYQALSCESAVVSVQDPEYIPEDLHRHIEFVKDHDEMVHRSVRLLHDPIARNRLRQGARKAVLKHTMIHRARQAWSIMERDIERLKEKTHA